MIKFLLKAILVAVLVVIVGGLVASRKGVLPGNLSTYFDPQTVDYITRNGLERIGPQLSSTLDSLVTHQGNTSPVVLGLQVSNDSLNVIVDMIQRLPPDKLTDLKNTVCTASSPSGAR